MSNTIFSRYHSVPFSETGDGVILVKNISAEEWLELLFSIESSKSTPSALARARVEFARSLIVSIDNVEWDDGEPFTVKDKELIPLDALSRIFQLMDGMVKVSGKKSTK